MKNEATKKKFFGFSSAIVGLFFSLFSYASVSASSLTISTSGSQSIDVSFVGTNTAISADDITVTTDCRTGYTLFLSSSVDDNKLYLNGLSSNSSSGFFLPSDGTTDLASATNTWGFYLPATNAAVPTSSSIFKPVPVFGSPVQIRTADDTASETDINDTFSVYYGVSVSNDMPSGQYRMSQNGTIAYYALAPLCSPLTIVYDGNNSDPSTAMAVKHENVSYNDTINLYASNYKKAGYGFAGWSTEQLDPDSASFQTDLRSAISDGLVFGPNQTITVNNKLATKAKFDQTIKLYAVWVRSSGDISDWKGCDKLSVGDVTALTDTRDGNVYAVAKLADENCWTIENLRLGTQGSSDSSKAQFFNGVFHGLANSESSGFTQNSTASNSLYSIDNSTPYVIEGEDPGPYFPRYNGDNTLSTVGNMTAGDQNVYSYGNYYSFSAAAANTENIATNYTSICPKGWTLPTGSQTTETHSFGALSVALGGPTDGSAIASSDAAIALSAKFREFPNNFVYSGRYNNDAVGAKTTTGAYWTRTSSFYFYFTNSDVRPGTSSVNRGRGNTVRCVSSPRYHIYYDKTASDAEGNGANGHAFQYMAAVSSSPKYDEERLKASNYSRSGYGFAGWSTDPNVASHINDQNHARIYGPNSNFSTYDSNLVDNADSNYNVTLYAIWVPSSGSLQNWNGCNSLNVGDVIALTDTRDQQTYAVAKLVDNKCWMIENLRLDPGTANITAANTNNPTNSFVNQVSSSTSIDSSSWCKDHSDSTCVNSIAYSLEVLDSLNAPIDPANDWHSAKYSFGVYYNWYTATAGNGTYASAPASGTAQATGDICPSGWHIPTGGLASESDGLFQQIWQSEVYLGYPNNFTLSTGIFDVPIENTFGTYLFLASSTAKSQVGAYRTFIAGNHYDAADDICYKTRGLPIRCVSGT